MCFIDGSTFRRFHLFENGIYSHCGSRHDKGVLAAAFVRQLQFLALTVSDSEGGQLIALIRDGGEGDGGALFGTGRGNLDRAAGEADGDGDVISRIAARTTSSAIVGIDGSVWESGVIWCADILGESCGNIGIFSYKKSILSIRRNKVVVYVPAKESFVVTCSSRYFRKFATDIVSTADGSSITRFGYRYTVFGDSVTTLRNIWG